MTDDTFQIRGYSTYDDVNEANESITRQTVQFDYQINGQVYSAEHFLDTYGDSPSADELNAGLQNWLITEAKPQLAPEKSIVAADLEALVIEAPIETETVTPEVTEA
jgi:hypothetical protein